MADLQHATLPEDKLHYPKGASTAQANTWMKANGDGTTSFAALPTSTFSVEDTINSSSTISQELATSGTDVQLKFGNAATSPNGKINVKADGSVVANEVGLYTLKLATNVKRAATTDVNAVSFAVRLNGTQIGNTVQVSLDSADAAFGHPIEITDTLQLSAGDSLTLHMRYTSGTGNVGVYPVDLSATGWNNVPSAFVSVSKIGG